MPLHLSALGIRLDQFLKLVRERIGEICETRRQDSTMYGLIENRPSEWPSKKELETAAFSFFRGGEHDFLYFRVESLIRR